MEIFGYFLAAAIGVSLGLIGGGGSILAVPVLAYLFGMDEKVATAYSLFIVGTAALVGGFRAFLAGSGRVQLQTSPAKRDAQWNGARACFSNSKPTFTCSSKSLLKIG